VHKNKVVFNGFLLLKELGSGGYGSVYLSKNLKSNLKSALKL